MNLIVLGSRIYQPVEDVDRYVLDLPDDATITAYGSIDVGKRAVLVAISRGLSARNVTLSTSRSELLEAAKQLGVRVVIFVARDPITKGPTEGTAGLMNLLNQHEIPIERIDSPLPGRICQIITKQSQAIDSALTARHQEHRSRALINRALKINTELLHERDRIEEKLKSGFNLQLQDEDATDRWLRWLTIYEQISKSLNDAAVLLKPVREVAA